ncbi:MAG: TIGR00266 family protein [Deltaproteobacteria bacterium]|nr:TIGR00266 family protein [Deltaproteobacteria bacterium]MCW5804342.1 TIGR00266 family protein [Deltaproteobacteria bacterium]
MSTDAAVWYVGIHGQQQGPLGTQQIIDMIRAGTITQTAYVYGQSNPSWVPIHAVPAFSGAFHAAPMPPPPPPPPAGPAPIVADQIDFEMFGDEMQFVEIVLDPGEAAIAEAGAFFYMDPGIRMETVMGDGSKPQQGFMDKLLQAGKRLLTGESLFMTIFHNDHKTARQKVSFAAPYPGKIIPVDLRQYNGTLICQKDAFLCAAKGISVGIALQKKIGAGLFGGEGFILQKLEGQGLAFIHAGGTIVAKELAAGEMLRLDTGCLVAFEPKVNYDIQWVGGFKTALFGGEGLFFATLTGPGKVWLQSLPFSRLAGRILAAAAASGFGRGPDEGSAIGGVGLGS